VTLAWFLALDNVTAIPKATSEEHIRSNWGAYDVELDDGDMDQIAGLDEGHPRGRLRRRALEPVGPPRTRCEDADAVTTRPIPDRSDSRPRWYPRFSGPDPSRPANSSPWSLTLLVSTVVFFGIVPVGDITTLFLAPVVAFVLTMVVVAETLVAGYRALGDSRGPTGRLTERLADRPLYAAAVRTLEAGLAAVAAVAGFVALVAWIPDGPMAGPGAIGVFFVVLGLAALVLVGTLIRTVAEYVDYRRSGTV